MYQQQNLKNKLSKQENRDRIMDTESVLMVARWEGRCGGMSEEVGGLRSPNR